MIDPLPHHPVTLTLVPTHPVTPCELTCEQLSMAEDTQTMIIDRATPVILSDNNGIRSTARARSVSGENECKQAGKNFHTSTQISIYYTSTSYIPHLYPRTYTSIFACKWIVSQTHSNTQIFADECITVQLLPERSLYEFLLAFAGLDRRHHLAQTLRKHHQTYGPLGDG